MKKLLAILSIILFCGHSEAQTLNENYDSTLAKSFGADDYGMKKYVMVLLRTGSNKTGDKAILDSVFGGHLKNINKLADEGKLVVAGPFFENDKYEGIFILNVDSIDDAKVLLETDPAISGKFLEADLYNWYGSAALKDYLKTKRRSRNILFESV